MLAADTFQLSVISEHCLTPKSFACQGQISFPELPTSSDKHMLWEYKAPLPHHHVGLPPENIQASVYLEHWLKPLLSLHHKPPSPLPNLASFRITCSNAVIFKKKNKEWAIVMHSGYSCFHISFPCLSLMFEEPDH